MRYEPPAIEHRISVKALMMPKPLSGAAGN